MAALPCPRASTAGESALAAEAWLLSGEEVRFSTRRIMPPGQRALEGASRSIQVRLPTVLNAAELAGQAGSAACGVVSSGVAGAYGCAAEGTASAAGKCAVAGRG